MKSPTEGGGDDAFVIDLEKEGLEVGEKVKLF